MLQTASEEVRSRVPSMAAVGATGDSDCVLRWVTVLRGRRWIRVYHPPEQPAGARWLRPTGPRAANGALEGLRAAVGHPQATANEIVVCLDNLAAATGLRGTPSDSSQAAFLEFQDMALAHGNTTVRWIPGHTNIAGNEQADALAKAGCSRPAPPDALPTLAHLRRVARKQPREAFDAWWTTAAPERYKPLKHSRHQRAAPRNLQPHVQPCTTCWRHGHTMEISPTTTGDSNMPMRDPPAHADAPKSQNISSTAGRCRRITV
ncbi:Ribonuclease H-like protein [Metarhizium guizhouense ARSEF 977]|uniref:Ribonuclease H-like protein n=1 Tax=Metarhizium guizhouense (strain ARSEF 977) TaxID=1276136 RepID=A0A0B4H8I5_METGA|nr:Ribonuclease H-like protein [Metarhizium guizhouense ARSEF 977]